MTEQYELISEENGAQIGRLRVDFKEILRVANQISGIWRGCESNVIPICVIDSSGYEVYRTGRAK